MKTILGMTKNSVGARRQFLGWLAVAVAAAITMVSAHAACQTQAGVTSDPAVTIGLLTSNPMKISATVTTTCGGYGCTNPPTLVDGTIRLDLCKDGVVKYSGTANLVPGPGTQTQVVKVSVPITPKVNGTYTVVRTVFTHFSDGSTSSYSFDCNGQLLNLHTAAKKAAAKKK